MVPGLTKKILVVDAETASPVDLRKEGQYRYWEHPKTRTLMAGYKWLGSQDPAEVIDFELGEVLPGEIIEAIAAPPHKVLLAAANAPFDQAALKQLGFPTPDSKWLDVLSCSRFLGFSGTLNQILKQVFDDPSLLKAPQGTRCITMFSVNGILWHEQPEMWEQFVEYCRQDVQVEELLLRWCLERITRPALLSAFLRVHQQDLIYRRVNRRGIPIDMAGVEGARRIRDTAIEELLTELKDLTQLPNPNSRDQLLGWLQKDGIGIENLKKDTIRDALKLGQVPKVKQALRLRQEVARSSTKKLDAMARATSGDGRLRGGWQFYGAARTGRPAGRVLNPANLMRPVIKDPEEVTEWLAFGDMALLAVAFPEKDVLTTLSSCIRALVKAPAGKKLVIADRTSIESVGSAWLAGCKPVLDIFAGGRDTYTTMAATALSTPYEEVTKEQRTFYKPVVLGGVYRLGAGGLMKYAAGMGVELTRAEAEEQIHHLRSTWKEYPEYWDSLERAAINAVYHPGTTYYATASGGRPPKVPYHYDGEFLYCRLPSGRPLCYYHPRIAPATIRLREDYEFTVDEALHYWGTDQLTGQWKEINVHSGGLLENITQALCRDVEWIALPLAEEDKGLELIGDVYDEPWALADEDDTEALARLLGYLRTSAPWLDETFYLGAEGYTARRYRKG